MPGFNHSHVGTSRSFLTRREGATNGLTDLVVQEVIMYSTARDLLASGSNRNTPSTIPASWDE